MKLASTPTLLLVLNLSASMASDQHLRVRQLTNTTDAANSTVSPAPAPTVSPAPTTSEPTTWEPTTWETYVPTTNSTTVTYVPTANVTVSPAPTTSEPTAAPTTSEPTAAPTNEPSAAPTRELTAAPTIWTCPEDVLVPIGTWDEYYWRELPSCVQDAAAVYGYDEESWDGDEDLCPDFCEEWWKDLTDEQQWASFVFGYNEEIWNNSR
mmetsp:Transcript_31612/g.46497  ORF Transcript_31612/g.46497 Transcript_31612/m.46497 type:complete len:209 (+) Transcript_31612:28-654(+)